MKKSKTLSTENIPYLGNPFQGRWEVIGRSGLSGLAAWFEYERGGFDKLFWEFEQLRVTAPPTHNRITYDGQFTVIYDGKAEESVMYSYYPDTQLLITNASRQGLDEEDDKNLRVKWIDDKEIWLFDLEDVEVEPDHYHDRWKIRKVE